jgi:hypothetical protein
MSKSLMAQTKFRSRQTLFAAISSPQNYGAATEFTRPSKNGGVFSPPFQIVSREI